MDGEPFRLATPRKSLQVFVYLLLNRTSPVSREYLAFLLWPDDEETSARSKLRGTLRDLQLVLPQPPEDFVQVAGERLCWNPENEPWVDVEAFEAASRDPARVREAIDLYRGDLLPELYDEWLFVLRERYRNTYLRCLAGLVSEQRREGEFSLAIETARKILAVDPWREDIVRRIMAMRNEAGDRAGALNEYAAFRERLHAEMGIEPMPETAAAAELIADGRTVAAEIEAERGEIAPARAPRGAAGAMLGREHEMEGLLQAWSRAKQGHGGVVFLGGEPGIGKSRLALEVMRAVEDEGGRVLAGATGNPESFPFQALVEAFRSGLPLVAALGLSKTWFAALATLVPELVQRVGPLAALPPLDPQGQSLRLFEAMTRAIVELARPRPVLLVLEDLHWASDSTFEALAFIARQAVGARVLIVATFRDDEAHRRHPLRRLQRETELHGAASTLSLGPLDLEAVTEFVRRTAEQEVAADFAAAMYARSGGNPLFLAQLLAAPVHALSGAVPPTIASLVGARIAALPDRARTFAEIAAFAGERFSLEIVRDVAGWDDAAAMSALDDLLDRRIVRETTGRGIFRYAFAHQLVQQAVLDASPAGRLRERSRRTARVLLELYPERAEELAADIARHLENGGEAAAAAEHYLIAARRAVELGSAPEESMRNVTKGLALATARETIGQLLLVRESIHGRKADAAARTEDLAALAEIADATNDRELLRTVFLRRLRFATRERSPQLRDLVDEMRRRAVASGSLAWQADADYGEGFTTLVGGNAEDAVRATRRAIEAYSQLGDDERKILAMALLAHGLNVRGESAEARAISDEAVVLAERAGKYEQQVAALRVAAFSAMNCSDPARVAEVARRHLDLAVAAGDRPEEAFALAQTAWPHTFGASFVHAVEPLERALAIARECDLGGYGATFATNLSLTYCKLGAFAKAVALREQGIVALRVHLPGLVADASIGLVLMLAFNGEPERAAELGRTSLATVEAVGDLRSAQEAHENLAEAELLCGRRAVATAHFEAALRARLLITPPLSGGKSNALLALLKVEDGDLDAALARIAAAGEPDAPAAPEELWPQRVAWALAFAARAAGDGALAQRWLHRAHESYEVYLGYLDPEQRATFDALPWHRPMREAYAGRWPERVW